MGAVLVAAAACLLPTGGVALAAEPGSGSVSNATPTTSWTGTAPMGSAPPFAGDAGCSGPADPVCDHFKLTIEDEMPVSISIDGAPPDDWDLFVFDSNGVRYNFAASPGPDETLVLWAPEPGTYDVAVLPYSVSGGSVYKGTAAPFSPTWTEKYITTADGERLHADVLRKTGLTDADKTPVILVVSPYLGQADPTRRHSIAGGHIAELDAAVNLFERGYSVVLVSTRGTGGSTGCFDLFGAGEQEDVRAAVEWSASQPWSTGKVGMYGISYDGMTGVIGAGLRPPGLRAVVAQQVLPDYYRGMYSDRLRLRQSVLFPSYIYGVQGERGSSVMSPPEYILNGASHSADCQVGLVGHYDENRDTAFWKARDLVSLAKGSRVPTLLTGGYLDANTNIGGGTVDLFNALEGPKRMWIGWWDHFIVEDRRAMGRPDWNGEVMRFFDKYLKGIEPSVEDPKVVAQSSDGEWHTESRWPPRDVTRLKAPIRAGTYTDDGRNLGSRDVRAGSGGLAPDRPPVTVTGAGTWTFSAPFSQETQIAGVPAAKVDVAPLLRRTNLVVNVYDVTPTGQATMITRGGRLVDSAGPADVALYPTDWTFAAGHRIGILVSGANAEAYVHVPTLTEVTVRGGFVDLPVLRSPRSANTAGGSTPRLERFKAVAPFTVPSETVSARTAESVVIPTGP